METVKYLCEFFFGPGSALHFLCLCVLCLCLGHKGTVIYRIKNKED